MKGVDINKDILIRSLYTNHIALPIPLWWGGPSGSCLPLLLCEIIQWALRPGEVHSGLNCHRRCFGARGGLQRGLGAWGARASRTISGPPLIRNFRTNFDLCVFTHIYQKMYIRVGFGAALTLQTHLLIVDFIDLLSPWKSGFHI